MALTDWLISHEAQNIILCSLFGISKDYQSYKIKQWRSQGINVVISYEDTTKEIGVKNLLHAASSLGPIDGIFTIAMVKTSRIPRLMKKNQFLSYFLFLDFRK